MAIPLSISLEPFPFGATAGVAAPVQEFREGVPIPREKETPVGAFSKQVGALWAEAGPKFVSLTEEKVKADADRAPEDDADLEQTAREQTEEQVDIEGEEDTKDEVSETKEELSYQEMSQLKVDMTVKLSHAWNEINSVVEICQALLPDANVNPPIYPDPRPKAAGPYVQDSATVPQSSLTMTPVHEVSGYRLKKIEEARMSMTRNRKGLKEARAMLEAGAKGMRATTKDGYWKALGEISGLGVEEEDREDENEEEEEEDGESKKDEGKGIGRWGLLPRWLDDRTPIHQQLAKDVMIPYAADEAAPRLRGVFLAHIASQLPTASTSSSKPPSHLVFPPRPQRRLVLSIRTPSGSSRSVIIPPAREEAEGEGDGAQLAAELEEAQASAFDQEIYEEIVSESKSSNPWNAAVTLDKVVLQPVSGVELRFEMISPDAEDDILESTFSPTQASLLLAIIRLRMLQIYRHRKAQPPAHARTPGMPNAPPRVAHPILPMAIAYIRFQEFMGQVHGILRKYGEEVKKLGLKMWIEREDGKEAGGLDWAGLMSTAGGILDVAEPPGGVIDVVLDGRQIVSILASTSCQLTLVFPHLTLVSQDIAQLPSYLSLEIQKGVVHSLRDALVQRMTSAGGHVNGGANGEPKVVMDEARGTVTTKDVKVQVTADPETLKFMVEAFKIIRKEGGNKVEVVTFEARPKQKVASWLQGLCAA